MSGWLRYVSGDYREPSTFARLRKELGNAEHPLYYLAIPPSMFPIVIEGLAKGRLFARFAGGDRKTIRA